MSDDKNKYRYFSLHELKKLCEENPESRLRIELDGHTNYFCFISGLNVLDVNYMNQVFTFVEMSAEHGFDDTTVTMKTLKELVNWTEERYGVDKSDAFEVIVRINSRVYKIMCANRSENEEDVVLIRVKWDIDIY
jgi:hypothetical protein